MPPVPEMVEASQPPAGEAAGQRRTDGPGPATQLGAPAWVADSAEMFPPATGASDGQPPADVANLPSSQSRAHGWSVLPFCLCEPPPCEGPPPCEWWSHRKWENKIFYKHEGRFATVLSVLARLLYQPWARLWLARPIHGWMAAMGEQECFPVLFLPFLLAIFLPPTVLPSPLDPLFLASHSGTSWASCGPLLVAQASPRPPSRSRVPGAAAVEFWRGR